MPVRNRYARTTREVAIVIVAKVALLIALGQIFFPASHRPATTADAVATHLLTVEPKGAR
jgi:hypothetical protein